jgi:hypothetical protein
MFFGKRKIDILSKKRGIAGRLSNFTRRDFMLDGVHCRSIEGVLQSLKFQNPNEQQIVCGLWGIQAKYAGENKNWKEDKILYWQGKPYKRESAEYQKLIDYIYKTVYEQDKQFQKDVKKAAKYRLIHSIGKTDILDTILTEKEFIDRLTMFHSMS